MYDKNERTVDRLIRQEHDRINKRIVQTPGMRLSYSEQQKQFEREQRQAEHDYLVHINAELEFDHYPISEVPDDVVLSTYYLNDVHQKVEFNNFYADYYLQRYENTNLEKYADLSQRVRNCHKSWFGDHYKNSGYFNVKRVYHCHNRWCWLCSHLKQAKRLYYYQLMFDELLKDYDLYHCVFTVRNVSGAALKTTLSSMHNAFKKIVRYFQGFGKIAGIDFVQYGLAGAIRSFEIVINPTDYHPHIHSLFLLKKGLDFPQTEINKYSFDHGVLKRKFSKFEVLLQKIFYLLVNRQKVTVDNISALPFGYSCTMNFVEGNAWHEVFKYATKMSKDGSSVCTYEQFVLLDDIMRRTKMFQGYGLFYDTDKKADEPDPMLEILFEKIIILLNRKETPERDLHMELNKLVDEVNKKKLTVISKKLSYKYLRAYYDELRADSSDDDYTDPF